MKENIQGSFFFFWKREYHMLLNENDNKFYEKEIIFYENDIIVHKL